MKRRKFLKHTGHAVAIPSVISSFGFNMASKFSMEHLMKNAAESGKVLVMVFLEGGNDGLNTVVPLDQLVALNAVRKQVILPEDKLHNLRKSEAALHPSLSGLARLYDESRLQVIQSVGYPEQDYSHFRSTDIWMSASDQSQNINSGWTGRYLNEVFTDYPESYPNENMPDPLAIEIGYGGSLLFQGPSASMSMVINNVDSFYELLDNVDQEVPDTLAGDKLKHVRLIARQSQQYGKIVTEAASKVTNQKNYPADNYLAQQLKVVARLVAGGLQTPMYMVRLGGFDTHSDQVQKSDHTTGNHADLLSQLNDAIVAFMDDTEALGIGDRVLGMSFSEFGRRIVSNNSLGTDHGAAAPLFLFGNAVKGGVLGDNPAIHSSMTYEDNVPHQYDFRQIYASILEQWFEVDASTVSASLFREFETVPIIGNRLITATSDTLDKKLIVYPNPIKTNSKIELMANGSLIHLDLLDIQGKVIQKIYRGTIPAGSHVIPWISNNVAPGRYFVRLRQRGDEQVFSVVKV